MSLYRGLFSKKTGATGALKGFRNRLLIFNLISLCAVMLISFSMIFFVLALHMHQVDRTRLMNIPPDLMSNIISEKGSSEDGPPDMREGSEKQNDNKNIINKFRVDTGVVMDFRNSFVLNIDDYGAISVYSRIDMPEDAYVNAADAVLKAGNGYGKLKINKESWIYRHVELPAYDSIVFLNVEDTDTALKRMALSMVIAGLLVLAAFFLISRAFANRAMRPAAESFEKQRSFIADASHELKTPLAIIDANAEAALAVAHRETPGRDGATEGDEPSQDMDVNEVSDAEEELRMFISRIEDESSRMRELVESLLYLSRVEEGAEEDDLPVDLTQIAENEISRIDAILFEKNVKLEFRSSASHRPIVKCGADRLRQVILILLDNAVKYTPEGGFVVVETGISEKGREKSGYISVKNSGSIDAGDLPHVFDRFYRSDKSRSSEGYGLGLSIAKAVVTRAGGRISAESAGGESVFTVFLPHAPM